MIHEWSCHESKSLYFILLASIGKMIGSHISNHMNHLSNHQAIALSTVNSCIHVYLAFYWLDCAFHTSTEKICHGFQHLVDVERDLFVDLPRNVRKDMSEIWPKWERTKNWKSLLRKNLVDESNRVGRIAIMKWLRLCGPEYYKGSKIRYWQHTDGTKVTVTSFIIIKF